MKYLVPVSAACMLLSACATPQENPHYRHSSQYKGQEPTAYADSGTGQTAQVIYQSAPAQSAQRTAPVLPYAPEAAPIASSEMIETGGQNAGAYGQNMQIAEASPMISAPAPRVEAAPQPVGRVTIANSPATAFNIETRSYEDYIVQEGDTVYSLSRARCVSVDTVKSMNDLDASFTIKAGAFIRLPQSRC